MPVAPGDLQALFFGDKARLTLTMHDGKAMRFTSGLEYSIDDVRVKREDLEKFTQRQKADKGSLSPREYESLFKLVIGMAIRGYTYDPAARRSGAIKDICTDLAKLDIALSDDTVRYWLRTAADTVLAKKPRQS